jgi:hypothetical protein
VLVRPRNAGLISSGRPDRNEFEVLGRAQWEPIVDEETWRACHALLMDPARRIAQNTEPRWLGSSTYLCGRCGATMRPTSSPYGSQRRRTRRYHYRCSEQNHLSIAAVMTDEYVKQVVAERVRDPRVVAAMTASEGDLLRADRERRTVLVTRLAQTEEDYDNDLIDARRYKAKVDKITAELEEIEERLAAGVQQATVSPIFAQVDPGQAFLSAPVDVQRAVLRAVLRVEVQPVVRRGDKWSSDRLVLTAVSGGTE